MSTIPVETLDQPTKRKLRLLASFRAVLTDSTLPFGEWSPAKEDASGELRLSSCRYFRKAQSFVNAMTKAGVVEKFDISSWRASPEGVSLVEQNSAIRDATPTGLFKLVTYYIRGDRFTEGLLLSAYQDEKLASISARAVALLVGADPGYSVSQWPSEYYGAVEHYFWEPQKLGCHASPKSMVKKKTNIQVMTKIAASEVALNHLLNLLFKLLPQSIIMSFIRKSFGVALNEPLETYVRPALRFATPEFCQPDILFLGVTQQFAVELKTSSKTSVDQFVKYSVFLRHFSAEAGRDGIAGHLLYMSPSADTLWPKGISSNDLQTHIASFRSEKNLRRFADKYGYSDDDIRQRASAIPFKHLSFEQFGVFLQGELDGLPTPLDAGDETLSNLLAGILSELRRRKLLAQSDRR